MFNSARKCVVVLKIEEKNVVFAWAMCSRLGAILEITSICDYEVWQNEFESISRFADRYLFSV